MSRDIRTLSIYQESSLLQAMQQMDHLDGKLLMVVDEKEKYLSIISIGDIQRYLIKHQNIEAKVSDALRANVRVAHVNDNPQKIREIMMEFRTEFMPVLDDGGVLKRVVFWEDIFEEGHKYKPGTLNIPVVIMAGGKGERLRPITNIIPKPLVPLGDKPIVQIIMEQFAQMGTKNFWLSVNYKADMIRQYLENIEYKNYKIHYIEECKPMGTAGSLSLIRGKVMEAFFVSNCDIIIDQDYEEVYQWHKENNNEITSVAAIKNYAIPYGTLEVEKDGLLKNIKEKPDMTFMVNAGVYLIEPHLLNEIPENEVFHITHLMDQVKDRGGRVGVFPVSDGSWMDIGNWVEYNKAQELYIKRFS